MGTSQPNYPLYPPAHVHGEDGEDRCGQWGGASSALLSPALRLAAQLLWASNPPGAVPSIGAVPSLGPAFLPALQCLLT